MDNSSSSIEVRKVLCPLKPADKKWPNWLLKAIKAAIRRGDLSEGKILDASTALHHAQSVSGDSWSDHLCVLKHKGDEILASYPYAEKINKKMLEELEQFCEILKLNYRFSANSYYYPGRTVAIFISQDSLPNDWPPQDGD